MRSFEEHLQAVVQSSRLTKRELASGECQSPDARRCTLCHAVDLDYVSEVAIKDQALCSFLQACVPSRVISPLTPSPLGRGYRTVTKRRVFRYRGTTTLGLIAPAGEGSYKPFDVVHCAIEPAAHAPIYRQIHEALGKMVYQPLAEVLRYVVIKGSYSEYTLILSVGEISPGVVSATNTLSRSLTHACKEIVALFLYEDKSDGRYYLGSQDASRSGFRKIFGNKEIFQRIGGRSFLYSPLSFSQVNISLADQFVAKAGELLALDGEMMLFDLYCGYGLFALCLAERVKAVIGVDSGAESIASAVANATRQRVRNARFIRSAISAETISRIIMHIRPRDVVLLDPPRSGTTEGVIESIASRRPAKALHIFCNIDIMHAELKRWKDSGYAVSKVVPFDMFPGTSSVEIMVLLSPA